MHVETLEVTGVRGFYGDRSVELDFRRPDGSLAGWTVLAGRNGSGKSTLLQALALVLSGPRATAVIPSLSDWINNDTDRARLSASLELSDEETPQLGLFSPVVWTELQRPAQATAEEAYSPEPEVAGEGLDSYSRARRTSVVSSSRPWFYVGYGPFRHLQDATTRKVTRPGPSAQIGSLFDETIALADAVDWLIEQRLYEYEDRPGAAELIHIVMALLNHGLLPDGFQVSEVNSDGLWISYQNKEFPLREMSDGYKTVTALVVDIVRRVWLSYPQLEITFDNGVPTLPYSGVVLIDEIEAHLHVNWQKAIGRWLKTHFPAIQFIVTTHSPYICQSADQAGIILMPGPAEQRPPRIIDDELYRRIIYGSGEDAVLTELFGVDTPYSPEAEKMRDRLGDLEIKVLDGSASAEEIAEYRELNRALTSSLSTRAEEVVRRLEREQ